MLLAVDIGNTQTHVGAFDGEELAHDWRLGTDPSITSDELAATLANLLELDGLGFDRIDAAIVSTVVPQLGPEYKRLCERHIGGSYLKVGPNLRTGMPILVDNPHELGADRLVNAVAAHAQVRGACITVDFGTSTNFDVVSGAGEYLGGVIGPGVEISMEALTARTAKLPRIDVSSRRRARSGRTPWPRSSRASPTGSRASSTASTAASADGARRSRRPTSPPAAWRRTIAPQCETIDASTAADPQGPSPDPRAQRLARPYLGHAQPPLTDPFRIGDVEIANRVLLAPLAGIGNWFVRLQAKRHGAGLAVSEMVSSFGLHYRNERTLRELLRLHPDEHPVSDPALRPGPGRDALGRGDRRRGGRRPDRHQHGLPGEKVCKTGSGAALLSDHELALEIARGRRPRAGAFRSPSSSAPGLKAGERQGFELAVRLVEEAGVAAIGFHPRSAATQHKGRPDYALTRELAEAIEAPVIVSGGLDSAEAARRAYEQSGAAAVMIARGSLGNPWIFEQLTGRRVERPEPRARWSPSCSG